MPYRAGPGNGMFGSHTTPPNRPMIDVGDTIDALTGGASSLLRQVYLQKIANNQQQEKRAEIAYQHSRDTAEDQRRAQELAQKQAQFDTETGLKTTAENHRFIEAGGIPAHTETQAVPSGRAAVTPLQPNSPISRAMIGGMALPGVQVTPEAGQPGAPIGGTVPVNTTVDASTPESYDPSRSLRADVATIAATGAAERERGRQEHATELQATRLKDLQAAREFARQTRLMADRQKATLSKATGRIGGAMTAGQAAKNAKDAAAGLIDNFRGSYDDAENFLNTDPEGIAMRDRNGIKPEHLLAARAAYNDKLAKAADPLTRGLFNISPDSAAKIVTGTREKLTTNQKPSAATPSVAPAPTGDAAPAKPAARLAAPKPAASSTPPADDFSDDEIRAAIGAGKTKPDDVRAFITDQRKKKKGGK